MKATNFELRHPVFIHQVIVAAAFSDYLLDPEDTVWRFIKQSPHNRLLEHACFLLATILIGVGAVLCTRAIALCGDSLVNSSKVSGVPAPPISRAGTGYFGEWLFAVGLASLAPLWGCLLLIAGEGIRLLRLALLDEVRDRELRSAMALPRAGKRISRRAWSTAIRVQAAKWGIFISMILFTVLLIDRLVETMAIISVMVWMILNIPAWIRDAKSGIGRQP